MIASQRSFLLLLTAATAVGCASKPVRPSVAKTRAIEEAIQDTRSEPSLLSRLRRSRVEAVDVPVWTETPVRDPAAMKLAYAKWMASAGNTDDAVANYEAVLTMQPDNVDALLGLAKIEADAGRTASATARFERIAALAPDSAEALAARGEFALMQGRPGEAIGLLSQAVRRRPNDSAVKHRLGIALARDGRTEEARELFVATVGPAEAACQIGLILRPTDPRAAAQEFQKALALKPSLTEAREALIAMGGRPASVPAGIAPGRNVPSIRPASHAGSSWSD